MKSSHYIHSALCLLVLIGTVNGFMSGTAAFRSAGVGRVALVNSPVRRSTTTLNMVFGERKTRSKKEEEKRAAMYWQGDWVCKDCGYIYNRVSHSFRPACHLA